MKHDDHAVAYIRWIGRRNSQPRGVQRSASRSAVAHRPRHATSAGDHAIRRRIIRGGRGARAHQVRQIHRAHHRQVAEARAAAHALGRPRAPSRRRRVERRTVAPALLDELQAACESGKRAWCQASGMGRRRRLQGRWRFDTGVGASAPALQTLIVLSADPETIVLPSGEKATERM